MRHFIVAASAVLLLSAAPASAQHVDEKGNPYRAWDVSAAFGFHSLARADRAIDVENGWYAGWEPAWAGSLDVGRYWTSHFKTEAEVMFLPSSYGGGRELVTTANGQSGYAYLSNQVRQTQVVLAGTWQFLDNSFVHPYMSAGVRVGLLDVTSHRDGSAYLTVDNTYRTLTIPPQDRRSLEVRARPFAAIGSKSYFSERTFVRPELVLGFNDAGLSQFGARLGFGIDF